VIVEETRGSGVKLASSCNGIELTIEAFGLLERLYDEMDKGSPTVVARLVVDEAYVSHKPGAKLSACEVRLDVVGVVE